MARCTNPFLIAGETRCSASDRLASHIHPKHTQTPRFQHIFTLRPETRVPLPQALRRILFVVILLSIAVRFVNIDATVICWHSWRQADTAALGRNFHDSGEGILFPRVDWGGDGHVETEFEAYTYLVSLMYGIFGVHEEIGRLISVLFSILAIAGVYFLARRFYGANVGLIASALYAVLPLTMFYGRAFMPESMRLSLIIWGLHFFDRWRESQRWTDMSVA